ncbi:MAG TPA: HEPN domain-containing protein [Stellaceae bacterium]|nr:HEPN domain-containing protein [Stellaceae bacterium]
MTPESGEPLAKARDCLSRARIILAAGVGEDAGRDAYLAGFHAAQAVIRVRTGKTAKTHRGVHRILAQREPQLDDLALFLSQAYNLKAVADYELGPGSPSTAPARRLTRRRNSSSRLPPRWHSRSTFCVRLVSNNRENCKY